AASCLRATAYPAVVPALLWESEFVCVSSKKTSNIVILIIYFLRMKWPTHYPAKRLANREIANVTQLRNAFGRITTRLQVLFTFGWDVARLAVGY
ncbi:hypothetical protein CSV68_16795, partial [Sporosarcina sp. P29]